MNATNEIVKIAERQCKAHGIRVTKKRVHVFSVLLLAKKAISAYELVDSYKHEFNETVPVITVYRVLKFLQQEKLVHKLEMANKYVACAHIDCNDKHPVSQFLICKQCQKVKELSIDELKFEELKQTIEQAGFYLDNPQLETNCICEVCYTGEQ